MNSERLCQAYPDQELLVKLINDDCSLKQSIEFEVHLENCESCQQQLEGLAGGAGWWTKTASLLSTVDELSLPAKVAKELSASGSFVLPTLNQMKPGFEVPNINEVRNANNVQASSRQPVGVSNDGFDWTQILDPPSHPEMLGRIDQFEIESKLGQGGMGLVLKGFDRELNRAVAIKVLSPHLASNGTSRKRFAREAQAAAAVVHPNVIPIYSVKPSQTRPYIVMQLVAGHSLQSLVKDDGPLPVREIVRIAIQVADGLAAAHQQGLIHRDIKPANVLTEQDVSRVVITDFGLARATNDAAMTRTGWIAGTPHYMSPEQAQGATLDHRTDLFSLGGLIYFLATGREPFRAESPFAVIQKIINEQPTAPMELNCDLPPLMSDIIEKLLEKKPQDRFQSAEELRGVLNKYLAHLQQPQTVAKPNRLLTRRRRRTRRMWVCRLTGCLLGVAAWFGYGQINWPDADKANSNRSTSGEQLKGSSEGLERHEGNQSTPGLAAVDSGNNSEVRSENNLENNSEEVATLAAESPTTESLTNGPLFFDQSLLQEIEQLNREMDRYESSLQGTSPFATNPSSSSLGDFGTSQRFSNKFKELENSFERYEQTTRELDSQFGTPNKDQLDLDPGPMANRQESFPKFERGQQLKEQTRRPSSQKENK